MSTAFEEAMNSLESQLKDKEVIGTRAVTALDALEEKSGAKRVHVVLSFSGLMSLYLILGAMPGLVCNLVGFAYPCYMSFKAIQTTNKDDDTQWLTYWCVFGFFTVLDSFADPIMSVLPIYWLVKCIFMVYLYHPKLLGATKVYQKVVAPVLGMLQQRMEAQGGGSSTPPPEAVKQD